jgi:hypothetical protein
MGASLLHLPPPRSAREEILFNVQRPLRANQRRTRYLEILGNLDTQCEELKVFTRSMRHKQRVPAVPRLAAKQHACSLVNLIRHGIAGSTVSQAMCQTAEP